MRKQIFAPLVCILGLLLVWEGLIFLTQTPSYLLPAPSAIVLAFWENLPTLLLHAKTTLVETLLGLVLATAFGMGIALWMDACPLLRQAIYPLLVATQTIPVIVLAPIFIIYLGFGIAPKVLTVVLMCFFPITISFADALGKQDMRHIHLLQSLGAKPVQIYRFVKIPSALPAFFSGLQVSATYSISGAVVGEWLSSDSGLGYYMLRVKNGYMLDKVFASVLMIGLLSFLMTVLVRLIARYTIKPPTRKGD